MNNLKSIKIIAILACIYSINISLLEAQSVNPPPIQDEIIANPGDKVETLDLSYVYGGDFTHGESYSETEIVEKLMSYPNLVELNLSGQSLTPALMDSIHDHATKLKRLIIKGSVKFVSGDGMSNSWESLNQQVITPEMLQALLSDGSLIEVLDLSLSTINDAGLESISQGAHHLRQLYLMGDNDVTEKGITSLIEKLPNLELIDLSKYTLRQPQNSQESFVPKISEELIKKLSDRGIVVIQNERTPWF